MRFSIMYGDKQEERRTVSRCAAGSYSREILRMSFEALTKVHPFALPPSKSDEGAAVVRVARGGS